MTLRKTENDLFHLFRSELRTDLQSMGFSAPGAGQILNWFDPAHAEYLRHVDEWQSFLCLGESATLPAFEGIYQRGQRAVLVLCEPWAVEAIHLVARLFYKYRGQPRKETSWSEVKDRLHNPLPVTLDTLEIEDLRRILGRIRVPDLGSAIGRFGPGVTAESLNAEEKWTRQGFIPDVPPSLYRCSVRDTWAPRGVLDIRSTKIAEVPKTLKSNRIVSSEPAMSMFAQLAIARELDSELHVKFAGHVSLHDQEEHNRRLTWIGAATLDLSDASDHLSLRLVRMLAPQLLPVLGAVRSTHATFPDGSVVELGTFAPMGSGVCFPMLTLIGLAICQLAYEEFVSDFPGQRRPWFTVYGDDVICDTRIFARILDLYTKAGFVPNVRKSCPSGYYRESCGAEYLGVRNITPLYVRDDPSRLPAVAIERLCRLLDDKGFSCTAERLAAVSDCIRYTRYNMDLQRMEVMVRTITARQKLATLDGWDGLNRWFCIHTQGNTWADRRPTGVVLEVWEKVAWRFRASDDYPYLTHWLVTSANARQPEKRPRKKPLVA